MLLQTASVLVHAAPAILLGVFPVSQALAGPEGGNVVSGSAQITSGGRRVDIHQQTQRAVIDWRTFDVGVGETTQFHQPDSRSLTLNRVGTGGASQIHGDLIANGNIVIVNPNGVFIGAGAKVDVNGLLATTADIDNERFMTDNKPHFDKPGNPQAAIVNQGTITAKEAGLVGLVAPNVINNGVINARLGRVQLASGDTTTVDFYGNGLLEVQVSDEVKSQLVSNTGSIVAEGGTIAITAAAGREIVNSLVVVSGELRAPTVGVHEGRIIIAAEGSNAVAGNVEADKGKKQGESTVIVSAVLDASGRGEGERGGSIEITGDNIALLSGTLIDASGHSAKAAAANDVAVSGSATLTADKQVRSEAEFLAHDSRAGGSIRIGGDYLGGGSTAAAKTVTVDTGVYIFNDALESGDAGRTIIWSDGTTSFSGSVYARGGDKQGHGGFLETSGKVALLVRGFADLTAEKGSKGTYLLDPDKITIYGGVDPEFTSTDGTIDLAGSLVLWMDAADLSTVTLTYSTDGLSGVTANGLSGGNSITVSASVAAALQAGARIRLGSAGSAATADTLGADTYTIASIDGTTVYLTSSLTQDYTGTQVYRGLVSAWADKSDSANSATIADAARMPLWSDNLLDGMPGIIFVDDGWTFQNALSFSDSFTVQALIKSTGDGMLLGESGNSSDKIGRWSGGRLMLRLGGGHEDSHYRTWELDSGTGLLMVQRDVDYQVSGAFNGKTPQAYYVSPVDTVIFNNLGASGPGQSLPSMAQYFLGNAHELLAYDDSLSTDALALVSQYQSVKWGQALLTGNPSTEAAAAMNASTGYSAFTVDYLEYLSATADIVLQASNGITLDFQGDTLSLAGDRSITLTTDAGGITAVSSGAIETTRTTTGGNITMTATGTGGLIDLTGLALVSAGGDITLTASGHITTQAIDTSGDVTVTANGGTYTSLGKIGATTPVNNLTITARDVDLRDTLAGTGTLTLQQDVNSRALHVGTGNVTIAGGTTTSDGSNAFYLDSNEIARIQSDWNNIYLGRATSSAQIFLAGSSWSNNLTIQSANRATLRSGTLSSTNSANITISVSYIDLFDDIHSDGDLTFNTPITSNNLGVVGHGGNLSTSGGDISGRNISLISARTLSLNAGTGNVHFTGSVLEPSSGGTGNRTLIVTANDITLSGTIDAYRAAVTLNASDNISLGDATLRTLSVTTTGTGAAITTGALNAGTGDITLTTASGDITTQSIDTSGDVTINAGTGTFTSIGKIGDNILVDDLTITANDVTLGDDIYGSGTLTIRQGDTARRLYVGGTLDTQSGYLTLSADEVNRIRDGWGQIILGRSDTANGQYMEIWATTWNDPVTFNGWVARQRGNLIGLDDASFTFNVGMEMHGSSRSVTTAGEDITYQKGFSVYGPNASINSQGGDIEITGISHQTTNFGTFSLLSGGGDISISSLGGSLSAISSNWLIDADTGTLTIGAISNQSHISLNGDTVIVSGAIGSFIAPESVIITATNGISLAAVNSQTISITTTGTGSAITAGALNAGTGNITLTTASGDITTQSIDTSGDVTVTANGGTYTSLGKIGATTPVSNLTITARDVDLQDTLAGTGTLTLQPDSDATVVRVGHSAAGDFSVDSFEVPRIQNGWEQIIIGRATSAADLYIGSSNWQDNVTFRNAIRTTLMAGNTLSSSDGATIDLNVGWVDLRGNINADGAVTFNTNHASLRGLVGYGGSVTTTDDDITLDAIRVNNGVTLNAGTATVTVSGAIHDTETWDTYTNRVVNISAGNIVLSGGVNAAHGTLNLTSINGLTLPAMNIGSLTATTTGATGDITLHLNGGTLQAASDGFISLNAGRDILDSSAGSITTNGNGYFLFTAGRDIVLNDGMTFTTTDGEVRLQAVNTIRLADGTGITTGEGAVILNADRNGTGGRIVFSGATVQTDGGDVVLGGGMNPYAEYVTNATMQAVNMDNSSSITTGSGDISMRGWHTSNLVQGGVRISNTYIASAGGNILIDGRADNNIGVVIGGSHITNASGNIVINAYNGNSSGIAFNHWRNAIIESTGSGDIHLNMLSGYYYTPSDLTAEEFNRIGSEEMTGDIYLNTNSISPGLESAADNNYFLTQGTIYVAPVTAGRQVLLGSGSATDTLRITNAMLSNLRAGAYVFGSMASGLHTLNTTHNFGDANVSFLSGSDINIASTLTKASGTSTVEYLFRANRNIYNSNNAGLVAGSGGFNLILNSDYDQITNPGGAIMLTGAAITSGGGDVVMGGGANPETGYALGSNFDYGIHLSGTFISSGAGDITLSGQGETTGNDNYGIRLYGGGFSTTTGAITLNGIGGDSGTSNNYGIRLLNGTVFTTTGTEAGEGDITLNAQGGGTSTAILFCNFGTCNADFGNAATFQTAGGDVTFNALGAAGQSIGGPNPVSITTGTGDVTFRANGNISFTGGITTQGGDVIFNSDRDQATDPGGAISLDATTINTGGGKVVMGGSTDPETQYAMGTTPGTGTFDRAVRLNDTFITTGAGDIILNGQGGNVAGGLNYGISLLGGGFYTTTGNITLNGIGGTAVGTNNRGIRLHNNVVFSTTGADGTGNITFNAQGGANGSVALQFCNTSNCADPGNAAVFTTVGGDVTFNATSGTGQDITAGNPVLITTQTGDVTFRANDSISLGSGSGITTGSGNIILNADRDQATNPGGNIRLNHVVITTDEGDIIMGGGLDPESGYAQGHANAATGYQSGIDIRNTAIHSGAGDIILNGSGGETVSNAYGIQLVSAGLTTTTGNITLNGIGSSLGASAAGIRLLNNVMFTTTGGDGTGNVTLNTQAGSGSTVSLWFCNMSSCGASGNAATISTVGGDVSFNAVNGAGHYILADNPVSITTESGDVAYRANGHIVLTNAGTITTHGGDVIFNSDRDQATHAGGRVRIVNGTITTHGGDVVVGGGLDPRSMEALGDQGVALITTDVSTGAGNIFVRGKGNSVSGHVGAYLQNANLLTTGGDIEIYGYGGTGISGASGLNFQQSTAVTDSGTIRFYGEANGLGSSDGVYDRGVFISGGAIRANTTGNIILTGKHGTSTASSVRAIQIEGDALIESNTGDIEMYSEGGQYSIVFWRGSTTRSIGGGNILFDATSTAGTVSAFGTSTDLTTAFATIGGTGTNSITVIADTYGHGGGANNNSTMRADTIAIRPKTSGRGISVGIGVTNTLNVSGVILNRLTANHYIFGSDTTGGITINTTRDFGDANLSFLTGANINLAGSLIKNSGSAIADYLFRANGNITNSGNSSILANSGGFNLTLNADYDQAVDPGGRIQFTGGSIVSGGGDVVMGGGTDPRTMSAIGVNTRGVAFYGGTSTISTGEGDIIINGHSTGTTTQMHGILLGKTADNAIPLLQTTSGNITINGTSELNANHGYGIFFDGDNYLLKIVTVGGDIHITGTGSPNAAILGTGLRIKDNVQITSTSGDITLIAHNPSGNGEGINITEANNLIGGAGYSGNITVIADSWTVAPGVFLGTQTTGSLTFRNYTAGTAFGIGSATTGGFLFTDAALALLNAGSYTFGSSTAGDIEIGTDHVFGAPVTFLNATGRDITLKSRLSSGVASGTAFVLASGNRFINQAGADALNIASGARWLVYSASPAGNARGGILPTASLFGRTYAANPPTGLGGVSGNLFLYATTVRPTLTFDIHDVSASYGDALPAQVGISYLSGLVGGDTVGDVWLSPWVAATYPASRNPGVYANAVSAPAFIDPVLGYRVVFRSGDLRISYNGETQLVLPDTVSKTTQSNQLFRPGGTDSLLPGSSVSSGDGEGSADTGDGEAPAGTEQAVSLNEQSHGLVEIDPKLAAELGLVNPFSIR